MFHGELLDITQNAPQLLERLLDRIGSNSLQLGGLQVPFLNLEETATFVDCEVMVGGIREEQLGVRFLPVEEGCILLGPGGQLDGGRLWYCGASMNDGDVSVGHAFHNSSGKLCSDSDVDAREGPNEIIQIVTRLCLCPDVA